jgi:hypothetical protein
MRVSIKFLQFQHKTCPLCPTMLSATAFRLCELSDSDVNSGMRFGHVHEVTTAAVVLKPIISTFRSTILLPASALEGRPSSGLHFTTSEPQLPFVHSRQHFRNTQCSCTPTRNTHSIFNFDTLCVQTCRNGHAFQIQREVVNSTLLHGVSTGMYCVFREQTLPDR